MRDPGVAVAADQPDVLSVADSKTDIENMGSGAFVPFPLMKRQCGLQIEPEINNVPILYFVCLPFKPQETFLPRRMHTS